jgi:hypothetical protein
MKKFILLTHVFIEPHEYYKIEQSNFVVEHYRKNNPDAYIIVTGHGIKPDKLEYYCDYVDWRDEIIRSELGHGHPILVNVGIDHAIEKGFSHILKSRLDSISLIPNIFDWCLENLNDKLYLTTQATTIDNFVLCDLFNFGPTEVMKKCWKMDNWYPNIDGLTPHAKNFFNICPEDNWYDALKNNCSFKDIHKLKLICFRKLSNWNYLKNKKEDLLNNILHNYRNYIQGFEGFLFDGNTGELIIPTSDRGIWATEKNLLQK